MKDKFIVDTNILIRIIVQDDDGQVEYIKEIIKKVDDGEFLLFVPTIVFVETCWVLKSRYKLSKKEITDCLAEIFQVDGVILEDENCLNGLISHAVNNVDFVDALLAEKSKTTGYAVLTWNAIF
ncbi:PIN domain-containing protein [Ammoniphilus sp. YIM 78166]|uniref:PIN domain-containing protein n=1 Tax=Ammoniphilus sp. YIM 78166 TaxID=1644106 RepID=UPI00106F676A|nr:PIN domain-containing protein [Ammoniphilus sp. YIM 78166]